MLTYETVKNLPEPHREAVRRVLKEFCETVKETGTHGAPSGVMYAAVMSYMTLDVYQQLMGILTASGILRLSFHCYYWQGNENSELELFGGRVL